MESETSRRGNLCAISRVESVVVHVSGPRSGRRARNRLNSLPAGTPVVLTAGGLGAAGRCAAAAAGAGIVLEKMYLAFPSADAPVYLIEDAPASVAVFTRSLLAVPPGSPYSFVLHAGVGALRALRSVALVRLLAPGRIAVGRRA